MRCFICAESLCEGGEPAPFVCPLAEPASKARLSGVEALAGAATDAVAKGAAKGPGRAAEREASPTVECAPAPMVCDRSSAVPMSDVSALMEASTEEVKSGRDGMDAAADGSSDGKCR